MNEMEAATILVVDDTPANLGVLTEVIESAGWQVRVAEDGASALEQLAFDLPDLVLLDVMMPGIDGFETCRRIKAAARSAALPVIFMTALAETADKVRGFEAGGADYITKPFQHEEVVARVRTHLDNARLRRALEEQNALKDRFMQIAAHDLRNPLASVMMAAELLLEMDAKKHAAPSDSRNMIECIATAAKRMNELIGSFLDFRKAAVNRLDVSVASLDLPALIRSIADNHASQASRKKIEIAIEIPEGLPPCSGDPDRSHQIVTNLVSNAVKYTPQGGRVRLCARAAGEAIRIDVADTGPGVPERERAKLFQEFADISTKPTGGENSTGLGLWIVRKMAEAQGGATGADFPPEGGSVFWVTWPVAAGQASGK